MVVVADDQDRSAGCGTLKNSVVLEVGAIDDRLARCYDTTAGSFGDLNQEVHILCGALRGPSEASWSWFDQDADHVCQDVLTEKEAELTGVIQNTDDI